MASGQRSAPHKQAGHMAAPTSSASPSKSPLPTGSRPHMTPSRHSIRQGRSGLIEGEAPGLSSILGDISAFTPNLIGGGVPVGSSYCESRTARAIKKSSTVSGPVLMTSTAYSMAAQSSSSRILQRTAATVQAWSLPRKSWTLGVASHGREETAHAFNLRRRLSP